MREELLKILGEYKVIGDTTCGLGYKEANELVEKIIDKVVDTIGTHTEHEGGYCDTGEDMEWSCRSDCVRLAIKRLSPQKEGKE